MTEILVITEGATERQVGKMLHEREVLSQRAEPRPPNWRSQLGGSREGYHPVISGFRNLLPTLKGKVLLMFDQEDLPTPTDRRDRVERDLGLAQNTFQPVLPWLNLFEYRRDNLHILLHVSTATAPPLLQRGDFDGYILQLLQGNHKQDIARALLGNRANPNSILKKAEQELTNLMEQNQYPWQTAKAWLYAYITVFQFRQSHVWFAERVVEVSPEDELKRVFASLIAAWDRLIF